MERFFINVVLVRVLFAHALVAAPRLALGWLAPLARPVGDPRIGMTGIFMSLSRVLPDQYPLGDDVETYVAVEHGFGHMLDIGIIAPRFEPASTTGQRKCLRCLHFGTWWTATRRPMRGIRPMTPMSGTSCRRGSRRPGASTGSLRAELVAFAGKRETTVRRLLDQSVDEQ